MKLEIDGYTKFILTVIAIALLLNVASPFAMKILEPEPVHASNGPIEVKVIDFRTTWPPKIEISNWPDRYPR
ncbi:MAG: hypothetical protein ACLFQV_07535 [Vulcanimicrobiota bacterium]